MGTSRKSKSIAFAKGARVKSKLQELSVKSGISDTHASREAWAFAAWPHVWPQPLSLLPDLQERHAAGTLSADEIRQARQ